MYLSECYDGVYQKVKSLSYIKFHLAYSVICSLVIAVLEVCNTLIIKSDIVVRLELGMPLILQLILAYIVYRQDNRNKFAKNILRLVFLHTIICGVLGLYEYYFTAPSFGIDLIYYVGNAQMVLQLILIPIMILFIIRSKEIDRARVIKPVIAVAFSIMIVLLDPSRNFGANDFVLWGMLILFIVNFFNPVLLYFLSCIAKGKRNGDGLKFGEECLDG